MNWDFFFFIIQLLFGLQYLFFGLNGFLNWLPPPPVPEMGRNFIKALNETGYLMPLIKVCEIVGGVSLVFGIFPSVGILILAPISINIFLFHFFIGNRKDVLSWLILLFQMILTLNVQIS